jgi:hypothetical protein
MTAVGDGSIALLYWAVCTRECCRSCAQEQVCLSSLLVRRETMDAYIVGKKFQIFHIVSQFTN